MEETTAEAAEPEQASNLPDQAVDIAQSSLAWAQDFLDSLMRPWNAYQIGIMIGLLVAAHIVGRFAGKRAGPWLRQRQGWPDWRMRIALIVHERLRFMAFVLLIWLTVAVMRELTWPSRSYLLSVVGNLALAWLIVDLASRLIANPLVRTVVQYGAGLWVSLRILGLTDGFVRMLDSLAFEMGDLRISVWIIVQAVATIGILFAIARVLSRATKTQIEQNENINPSMRVLAIKFLQVLFYSLAIILGLTAVGIDLTGLAVLSGAIGVGLGFGLQKVVSNLVSGVIILMDKSIKPGDVISLDDTFGWINKLSARYVSVVTRDGREYLIPNEDLITGQVVNWSHTNELVRLDIHFGTSYGDDPHEVRRIAIEAAVQVDRVLDTRMPVCHIEGFGACTVDYILRFWITDPTEGLTNVRGDVYLSLWDAFERNGITIPLPQVETRMVGQPPTREQEMAAWSEEVGPASGAERG